MELQELYSITKKIAPPPDLKPADKSGPDYFDFPYCQQAVVFNI
jgi:hypothetical protein